MIRSLRVTWLRRAVSRQFLSAAAVIFVVFAAVSARASDWVWTGDAWLGNGNNNWYGTGYDPWIGVVNNWGVPGGAWFPGPTDNVRIGQHYDVGVYNSISVGAMTIGTGTTMEIYNNNSFTIGGGLVNNGTITVNYDSSNPAYLTFSGSQTLSGSGAIVLTDWDNATDHAQLNTSGGVLTQTAGHTIRGWGAINAALINQGTINANNPGGWTLTLQSNPMSNSGLIEATNGGWLNISTNINNTGGLILASSGGVGINSGATISGGTLTSASGTAIYGNGGVVLNNVTISAGSQYNVQNNQNTTITGGLVNNGTITVNYDVSNPASLTFSGSQTLSGTGTIALTAWDNATDHAQLNTSNSGVLTQTAGHTILGWGAINAALINQGTINADNPGGWTLSLQGNPKTNTGLIEATNGGWLNIGTDINNTGGLILASSGGIGINSGATISGGTLTSASGSAIYGNGGVVLNNVTISAGSQYNVQSSQNTTVVNGLVNNGTITVNYDNSNPSYLTFSGSQTLSGTGTVVLNSWNNTSDHAQLNTSNNGVLTQGGGHTITGHGAINAGLVNNGTILANQNGLDLWLQTNNETNNALILATSGATVDINAIAISQGTAGTIVADAGTIKLWNGVQISNGTLSTRNGGAMVNWSMTNTLNNVTLDGILNVHSSTGLNVLNNLVNNGTITVNYDVSNPAALTFSGSQTLSGTGTIALTAWNNATDHAQLNTSGGVLTQAAGHTILGWGAINAALINQGTINADNPGGWTLSLQSNPMTNSALIEATNGGWLNIATNIDNTGGLILASSGGIGINSGATITSGTLTSLPGSAFYGNGGVGLNNVTISAGSQYNIQNNQATTVTGGLVNNGTITVNYDVSNPAYLVFGGSQTLSGTGTIVLTDWNNSTDHAQLNTSGGVLTQAAGHTILGWGAINAALINQGTINADNPGGWTLSLQSNPMTNAGLIEATNGGWLNIATNIDNTGGLILASSGGIGINSGATITSGTLTSLPGSAFYGNGSAGLNNVKISAGSQYDIHSSQTTTVTGGLVNNGTITVNYDVSNPAYLVFSGSQTLSGTGTIALTTWNNATDHAQLNTSGGVLTQAAGHTILGWGSINASLINQGTINANSPSGWTLAVTGMLDNQGTVEASNGGILSISAAVVQLSGGTLTGGTWIANPFSAIYMGGSIVTNQGAVVLNGPSSTFPAVNAIADNQGSFSILGGRSFTTASDLTNSGTLVVDGSSSLIVQKPLPGPPYPPPANLVDTGAVTIGAGSSLSVQGQLIIGTSGNLTMFPGSHVAAGSVAIEGGVLSGAGTLSAPVSGTLGGAINVPNPTDMLTVAGAVSLTGSLAKTGRGTLFISQSSAITQGAIVLSDGAFRVTQAALAASGNVIFSGGYPLAGGGYPTIDLGGTFSESVGSGTAQVQWAGNGGFAAKGGSLAVRLNGGVGTVAWATSGFVPAASALVLNSAEADNVVDFQNAIDLNGANRTVYVLDNPAPTAAEYARISGVISNSFGTAGLVKDGPGTLQLAATNSYNGTTTVLGGALQGYFGAGIPASTYLVLNGGVLETSGTFSRTLATSGAGSFQWGTSGGGFSANGGKLTVNVGGQASPQQLVWGGAADVGTKIVGTLRFGSATADSQTEFQNPIDLAGTTRTIDVAKDQVPGVAGDFATISGVISNSGTAAAGLTKTGLGLLELTASNTFNGPVAILGGTIQAAALYNLGSGTAITLDSGALRFTGVFDPSVRTMTFNAGGGTLDTADLAITLANAIGNGGPGMLTKAGAGRLTLLGNNTYGGNTAVSAGTLQLGGGGATGWIQGDVADNGVLAFNRSDNVTFPGMISGAGAVSQTGPGLLTFTGSNAYSGGTTITGGTLMVGGGGTLGILPGSTNNNSVLVFNHSDTYIYPGAIGGSGAVVQAGSGTLVYLGANSYTNGTTIANGSLQVGSGGTLGVLPGNTVDNGLLIFDRADTYKYPGTISGSGAVSQAGNGITIFTGSNLYTGGTTISAGALQLGDAAVSNGSVSGNIVNNSLLIFANPAPQTFSGVIGGSGNLVKQGMAVLTLGASNTFTGWTRISTGVLQTGDPFALQNSTLDMNAADAGTLDMGGNASVVLGGLEGVRNIAIAPGAMLTVGNDGTNTQYDGVLSGANSTLTKIGGGNLTLTASNTYTGNTTISAGALTLGAGSANGSVAGNIVDNSQLYFTNFSSQVYAGVVSGSGAVTKNGAGTLYLTGSNTFTGGLNLAAGTTNVNADAAIGAAANSVTFIGSSTLQAGGAIASPSSRNYTINGGVTASFDANGQTMSIAGVIGGAGALWKVGGGTLSLGGADTYTGNTRIVAGTLQTAISAALQMSTLDMNAADAGTLDMGGNANVLLGGLQGARNLAIAAGATLTVGKDNASTTYSGVMSGAGSSLVKIGNGILTLNGDNNYTGVTTINGGRLQLGDGFTNNGSVAGNIVNNAVLFFANPLAQTYSGSISGSGMLVKQGLGTLTLGGANSYIGDTVISTGAVRLASPTVFPSGAGAGNLTVNGLLDVNGLSPTFNGFNSQPSGRVTNLAGGAVTLTAVCNTPNTINGLVDNGAGTLSLTKSGVGVLTVNNNLAYTGLTSLSQGTLALTAASLASPVNISAGATLSAADAGLAGAYYTVSPWNVGGSDPNFANYAAMTAHFASMTPALRSASTSAGANFDFSGGFPPLHSGAFEAYYTGNYYAPSQGVYTFDTGSNDGSMLFVDGQTVVYNNYFQGVTVRSGTVSLTPGPHNVVIGYYVDGNGGQNLYADVTLPGGSSQRLTNAMLSAATSIGSLTGPVGSAVQLASGYLTVNQTSDGVFGGSIAGPGALWKSGSANLTLTGASAFTGGAFVNSGSLTVNGSLASAVTVNSGGLLAGGGTTGAVTVNAGGQVAAGVLGSGTLTVAALSLSPSSILSFQFGAGGNTQIDVTGVGGLTIGGGGVDLYQQGTNNPLTANGTYELIQYSGTLGGSIANLAVLNGVLDKRYLLGTGGTAGNQVYVQVTPGPVWNGGSSINANWSQAANWSGVAPMSGDSLSFDGTTRTNCTNDLPAGMQFSTLWFRPAAGAFTLSGNSLALSGYIVNNSPNLQIINLPIALDGGGCQVQATGGPLALNGAIDNGGSLLSVSGSGNVTFGGAISGSGALTMAGGGTLVLAASNTFSGGLNMLGGFVRADQLARLGSGPFFFSGGGLWITSNLTPDLSVRSMTFGPAGATLDLDAGSSVFTFNNAIGGGGSGSLTKTGPSTLVLAASNSFSGGVNVNQGMVRLASAGALGSGGLAVASGGTVDLNAQAASLSWLSGGAGGVITDLSSSSGVTTLTVNLASGTSSYAGSILMGSSRDIALVLSGSGTLVLSGTDTYRSGTTVAGGELILTSPNVIADGTSLTVGDPAAFEAPVVPGALSTGVSQNRLDVPAEVGTISAVPEPGTLILVLAFGLLASSRAMRAFAYCRFGQR